MIFKFKFQLAIFIAQCLFLYEKFHIKTCIVGIKKNKIIRNKIFYRGSNFNICLNAIHHAHTYVYIEIDNCSVFSELSQQRIYYAITSKRLFESLRIKNLKNANSNFSLISLIITDL